MARNVWFVAKKPTTIGGKSEPINKPDKEHIARIGQARQRWTNESSRPGKVVRSSYENSYSGSKDPTYREIRPENSKLVGHAETSLSC